MYTFPLDATESVDTDNDGIGNNADTDDDNDGVADTLDAFPLDASRTEKNKIVKNTSAGSFSVLWFFIFSFIIFIRRLSTI